MDEKISPMELVVTKMETETEPEDEVHEDSINLSVINEIKCRRHLWDAHHKLYKDSVLKKKSWTELAKKLGVREPFLKTRWRSLRDRFMKERRREIEIRRTGEPRKARPWQMMPKLAFLNKTVHVSISDKDRCKVEEKEETVLPNLDSIAETIIPPEPESIVPKPNVPPTFLIINADNTIQCLPSLPVPPNTRPFRRIQPAPSESPRNVTLTVSPPVTVAGSSTMTSTVQQVQSGEPTPRPSSAPTPSSRQAEPQPPENESSERYFYLSIAKEMEGRSTLARLKMRKIISDALLKLHEEDEDVPEGSTT